MQVKGKLEGQSLAEPGAGIPWLERKFLGVAVRLFSRVKGREYFSEMFSSEAEKIEKLAKENKDSELQQRVLIDRFMGIEDSSRDWSVLMTMDHLNKVNCGLSQLIMALTGTDEALAGCELKEVRIENVKPGPDVDEKAVDAFILHSKEVADSLSKVGDMSSSHTHLHPWFGRMNAREWYALLAIHMGLHRKQMEKILATSE